MGDIVAWKTGAELLALLATQNALVSGMSVSQAAAALGFTKTAAGLYVKSVVTTELASVAATTATAAATEVSAGAVTTAANLTLYETASGTAAVGGLGSIALPIAVSMAAAAGGYLLGNAIYEANSTFLDNLMFPVYDFITGNNVSDTLNDVPTVPVIIDATGNTFMHPTFHYNVKSFLDAQALISPVVQVVDNSVMGLITPIYKIKLTLNELKELHSFKYNYSAMSRKITLTVATKDVYLIYALGNQDQSNYKEWNNYYVSEAPFTIITSGNATMTGVAVAKTYNDKTFYTTGWLSVMGVDGTGGYSDTVIKVPITKLNSITTGAFTTAQLYYLLYGASNQVAGMPSAVTTYVPGTSPQPLPLPDGMPAWKPVIVPTKTPSIMPVPVPFPTEFPQPDPEKITPFIPPIQPQPNGVPIKKPATVPSVPLVPLPNAVPDITTSPSPLPNPATDPSVTPTLPTAPKVPVAESIPSGTGSTPTPVTPFIPPISPSAGGGLLHVYNPTTAQINEFGAWLWTTFSGDLIETLSKLFNNPMDAVIGLHELYCTPITSGATTIHAGYLDSGVASQLVSTRYTEIKCGALSVPEYWKNYLDYAPYTKSFCYLPFIGIVELNTDDIMGGGIEITYKIDTYNGSCIALITTAKPNSDESVTYEFSGNCSVEVPVTSGMKSAMQSALIGAATAALAAATGGAAAVGGAALVGAARQGLNMKNNVQHSGSFGSSYGAMGLKKPYLIIKRPKQKVVPGYNTNYGYPAHKMVLISTCSGYLKAIEVDVISPTATEDEKRLIEKQLKTGIFVD